MRTELRVLPVWPSPVPKLDVQFCEQRITRMNYVRIGGAAQKLRRADTRKLVRQQPRRDQSSGDAREDRFGLGFIEEDCCKRRRVNDGGAHL